MEPSIREVAREAGVSVGTVSNVLNRPAQVAEPTKARVLEAIEALNFVRNDSARQLRMGRSETLGVVIPDPRNPFFIDVASGIEELSDESGLTVVLCSSGRSVERERQAVAMLEQQRVRGMLIIPVTDDIEPLTRLHQRGMGVVLLDRRSSQADQCSVRADHETGSQLAIAHLIERGHRGIAYVSGPSAGEGRGHRHRGALEALAAARMAPDSITTLVVPELTVDQGWRSADRLLAMRPRPTAVFCSSDLLAIGVLNRLIQLGVRVPDDMAIVGYDDIELAGAAVIPLTTVRQRREQLGRIGAQLAIEEAEQPDAHRHRNVLLPPELVVRDTT